MDASGHRLRRRKALIVDDDATMCSLLRELLEDEGYTVVTARNATEALRQWDRTRPDLVLLDVIMPGMDGYQVCQRLRQWDLGHTTAIILLTSLAEEADQVCGLEVGADDYVTKPFSVKQLTTRIQTVLRRYGDAGGGSGPAVRSAPATPARAAHVPPPASGAATRAPGRQH